MPLDLYDTYDMTLYCGLYNRVDETFVFNSKDYNDISNGQVIGSGWTDICNYSFPYNRNLMASYGVSFSGLSISDGATFSFELDSIGSNGWDSSAARNIRLSNSNLVPYRVFADLSFRGTQINGPESSPTYVSCVFNPQTIEISQFMNPTDDFLVNNINFRIPISCDTSVGTNISGNVLGYSNIYLTDIKVYAVYPLQNNFIYEDYSSASFVEGQNYTITMTLRNDSSFICSPYLTYTDGNSGVSVDTSTSAIQSSISSLTSNVTNQLNSVKTAVTNSTNTITFKIDTMSQDIQTGLQNVVESAQQNTQNIINTVTQKVDEVKTGITEVKDSILDLPNKISEMLIGLVVPDEQTMIEQRDNWDNLLAERFGAVYESVEVMDSIAAAFQSSAETSTITLPAVTVGLAGTDFTFGGYDVEVVPEGFDSLVTALKLIIDIVVTLAFINAMKSRYEQLVSR